jgi:Fungal fucose-specific lectin
MANGARVCSDIPRSCQQILCPVTVAYSPSRLTGQFNPGKAPKHTTIGALGWYDGTKGMQLRVYWQDSQRNLVGYVYDNSWYSVGVIVGQVPRRVRASALDWDNGANIRVYFQADSRDILEHCYDGDAWFVGSTVANGGE